MTRINLVNVKNLADQHLFAEWREIKMVPAALRRSLKTRSVQDIINGIPTRYTLNKGHVTFFFDKMKFLYDRYNLLTQELVERDYDLSDVSTFDKFLIDIPDRFCIQEWAPDNEEVKINVERIMQRINEKPDWYRYYGAKVTSNYFETAYNEQT
jgi:deoxyribonuclease (pyrimidine dimer)